VIAEVDDALCQVVGRLLPPGAAVRLDAPKPAWQSESEHLSVDLFLFGLHAETAEQYVFSYLVTAHADKIKDEHELLDLALGALMGAGALRVELQPDDTVLASLRIADVDPTGLWTSLGMPARAGFVVAVATPVTGSRPA
jgi:hypothetical protein